MSKSYMFYTVAYIAVITGVRAFSRHPTDAFRYFDTDSPDWFRDFYSDGTLHPAEDSTRFGSYASHLPKSEYNYAGRFPGSLFDHAAAQRQFIIPNWKPAKINQEHLYKRYTMNNRPKDDGEKISFRDFQSMQQRKRFDENAPKSEQQFDSQHSHRESTSQQLKNPFQQLFSEFKAAPASKPSSKSSTALNGSEIGALLDPGHEKDPDDHSTNKSVLKSPNVPSSPSNRWHSLAALIEHGLLRVIRVTHVWKVLSMLLLVGTIFWLGKMHEHYFQHTCGLRSMMRLSANPSKETAVITREEIRESFQHQLAENVALFTDFQRNVLATKQDCRELRELAENADTVFQKLISYDKRLVSFIVESKADRRIMREWICSAQGRLRKLIACHDICKGHGRKAFHVSDIDTVTSAEDQEFIITDRDPCEVVEPLVAEQIKPFDPNLNCHIESKRSCENTKGRHGFEIRATGDACPCDTGYGTRPRLRKKGKLGKEISHFLASAIVHSASEM